MIEFGISINDSFLFCEDTEKYMRIVVEKPSFFIHYNNEMQWVDVKGRKAREYVSTKKSKRWQPHVYEGYSDICLSNAVVVWNRLNPGKTMPILEARKSVMETCFEKAYEGFYWAQHRKKKV